ncbi:hypothetical protein HYX03_02995 [Candidatus Woesearchaeota archaeon]|nr:hypothetical protein [Candidatus Woesearchaeota archaeon]
MPSLFLQNKRLLITTALIILGMILLAYLLRPVIIGYSAYQQAKNSNFSLEDYGKNVKLLEKSLLVSSTNLSACAEFNKKLLGGLDRYTDEYSRCRIDLSSLDVNYTLTIKSYEEKLKNIEMEIKNKNNDIEKLKDAKDEEIKNINSQKQDEINELRNDYELLAKNSANNLCCKSKVDNPRIRYYAVENSRIVCLEEGALSISC